MLSKLLAFSRKTRKPAVKLSESKVDPGGGAVIISEHFSSAGDDAFPMTGDVVAILPITRSRGDDGVAVGYADIKSEKKAKVGEKRIYARDSSGIPICEIWLKNDGEIVIEGPKATITTLPDGNIELKNEKATVNLAPDGEILLENDNGTTLMSNSGQTTISNDNGAIDLKADGSIDLNGVVISITGAITAPGTITAPLVAGTTNVTFGGKSGTAHTHSGVTTGIGNTGSPN